MANEYANIVDLLARVSIEQTDTREGQLLHILEAASRWVDQQTGHRFYSATQTRYYSTERRGTAHAGYGYGDSYTGGAWTVESATWGMSAPSRIRIDDLTAATVVATDDDGDGVYETTWTVGTDYWLGPRNAVVNGQPYRYLNRNLSTGRYAFPAWEEGIAITGSFGWSTLATRPADIRELTLMVAEWMAVTLTDLAQPGVQTYNITQELSVTMAPDVLPVAGQKILQYYQGMSLL